MAAAVTTEEKHSLSIMGQEGDFKVLWSRTNPDEVAEAREAFRRAREKGMVGFRVSKDGSKGEQVRDFNPDDQALIMVPQMAGG